MNFRSAVTKILDATLGRAVEYVCKKAQSVNIKRTAINVLHEAAIVDTAKYINEQMPLAVMFSKRENLWSFSVRNAPSEGVFAEFGVFEGFSINRIAGFLPKGKVIHGFDSFEGLGEDWKGHSLQKGAFSLGGKLPKVRNNVLLEKGWFSNTIPGFIETMPGNFAFCHIDCDTYEATRDVLELIRSRLTSGTVMVFDEFFGYVGWRVGEWKAWEEFVSKHSLRFEFIGFGPQQASIRLL
jgi:hypothetical protein